MDIRLGGLVAAVLTSSFVACSCSGGGTVAAAPSGGNGPSPERLAFWKQVRAQEDSPPAGSDLRKLSLELVGYLGSTDPEIRDRLAYEVLGGWIERDVLPAELVREIQRVLLERLTDRIGSTADDSVFGRSFSALMLAEIAAREVRAPSMSDEELTVMVEGARRYASSERDLRGHVGQEGWAHAAAHTADWLRFLARHPKLGRKRAQLVLEALLDLAVRRHGQILCHGEDGRMAQPIMDLLRQGHVDGPSFSAWLTRLLAPLGEPGGPTFDPALYAAQRNGRNLAFTLFVALSLEDKRSPIQDAALSALSSALRG